MSVIPTNIMNAYDQQLLLSSLVGKATDSKQHSLDAQLLSQIKRLCKISDENVRQAFELVYDRLKQPDSQGDQGPLAQARLLALQLCGELFSRSKAFRAAAAAKFTQILELAVGFRADRPLPPPAAAATRLRELALQLLEAWDRDHGAKYQQVALGHAYLRDRLLLAFPEIDARAAQREAQRAEQEALAQRRTQERYLRLQAGEFEEQRRDFESLVRQMAEGFAILDSQRAAEATAGSDLQWEDIPDAALPAPPHAEAASPTQDEGAEGLAAYAADAAFADAPDAAPRGQGGAGAAVGADDAVLEALAGLYRLATTRALPAVQEALRVLVQAEVGDPGQAEHAQREHMLRSATELRAALAGAAARFEALGLDLAALAARQAGRLAVRARRQDLIDELFGRPGSSGDEEGGEMSRQGGGGDGQPGPSGGGGGDQERSPYDSYRDPAAPRQRAPAPAASAERTQRAPAPAASAERTQPARAPSGGGQAGPGGTGPRPSSSLPEHVRRALAEKAPVLPGGAYTQYWDSSSAPTYVSGHGLEVSNHWGPVDVHKELPSERLEEVFLTSFQVLQQPGGGAPAGQQRSSQAQSAGPSGSGRSRPPPPGQRAGPSAPAQAPPLLALPAATHGEGREFKRMRRAAERAFNEAVISGMSDEALARAVADAQQASEAPAGTRRDAQRQARKKATHARQRLQRKLLGGRALREAEREASAVDDERHRDTYGSSRWENK